MSYLGPPFDHDLFVSYSHGDVDGTGHSHLKTWSQAFARELEGELKADVRFKELRVFLDQHHRPDHGVDPMEPLKRQLQNDIGASGLLMVLMSPHYLLSDWCGHERDWWLQSQEARQLAVDGRIAVAHIWPTHDPWPEGLVDENGDHLIGFTFYDPARAELRPQPHGWPDPTGAGDPFRDRILDMVGWIWRRLEMLKKDLEQRRQWEEEAARLAADGGQLVYLHARQEQADAWERAGNALVAKGLGVLPSEPEPIARDARARRDASDHRVEVMSGCDAVLLLGTGDGCALDADLSVVGHHDRNEARAATERPLPCGVVDTAGAGFATPKRRRVARALGIDWIEATRDVWPTEIKRWLNEKSAVMERA